MKKLNNDGYVAPSLWEEWRDVNGYEGKYQVSDFGRVRSLNWDKTGKTRVMRPGESNSGYLNIQLYKDGKAQNHSVHRLVWETFCYEIPQGKEIDHINTIRHDNRLENLRCVTRHENCHNNITRKRNLEAMRKLAKDPVWQENHRNAMHKLTKDPVWQENHRKALQKRSQNQVWRENQRNAIIKPVLQLTMEGELVRRWECAADAERELGVSHINCCCHGNRKSAGGYLWRFA